MSRPLDILDRAYEEFRSLRRIIAPEYHPVASVKARKKRFEVRWKISGTCSIEATDIEEARAIFREGASWIEMLHHSENGTGVVSAVEVDEK
jgi:hypothetical protein